MNREKRAKETVVSQTVVYDAGFETRIRGTGSVKLGLVKLESLKQGDSLGVKHHNLASR